MQRPEKRNLSCPGCGPRFARASARDLTMATTEQGVARGRTSSQTLLLRAAVGQIRPSLRPNADGKSSLARTSGRT